MGASFRRAGERRVVGRGGARHAGVRADGDVERRRVSQAPVHGPRLDAVGPVRSRAQLATDLLRGTAAAAGAVLARARLRGP